MSSPATQKGYRKGEAPANKGVTLPAEPLSPVEVRKLIMACPTRTFCGMRNRAMLTVMYRAGLRCAEALDLFPKDLDPGEGTVRVLHGKGDKLRISAMDPEAFDIVQLWLDRRRKARIPRRAHLFCTSKGNRLQASYVRTLLPRLAERVGIDKRVHPHALRHTVAAELMSSGVPLNVIQSFLGHSNVATTSRYLAHIMPTQVIEMARNRTWKGGGPKSWEPEEEDSIGSQLPGTPGSPRPTEARAAKARQRDSAGRASARRPWDPKSGRGIVLP